MTERLKLLEKIAEREAFLRARVSPWNPDEGWSSETEYLRDIDAELDRLYRKLNALGAEIELEGEEETEDDLPDIQYDFKAGENPAALFSDEVCRLTALRVSDAALRCEGVKRLTDAYIDQVGERPNEGELDELANWVIFGPGGLSLRQTMKNRLFRAKEVRHG